MPSLGSLPTQPCISYIMKVLSSLRLRAATQGMLTCRHLPSCSPSPPQLSPALFCLLRLVIHCSSSWIYHEWIFLFLLSAFLCSSFYYLTKYLKCFTLKNRVLGLSKETWIQISVPVTREKQPVALHLYSPVEWLLVLFRTSAISWFLNT